MNPATALAGVLIDELARCGVTDAVVSPGSRSTPLVLALHDHPSIRLHVRIDERSAGFCALGLAAVRRGPVLVVCTSGSAAANLHPAVVEADHSGIPLILLTADRPAELHGTGANQTMDQTRLFGNAVRLFTDVGTPEARPGMVRYWRSLAGRAVEAARTGPVHLNVPFRKPLVGSAADWPEPLDGRPGGEPWTVVHHSPPGTFTLDTPARGLVVAGATDVDPAAIAEFAEAAGWPILAEPHSNARRGPNALSAYGWLVRDPDFLAAHRPDLVVTVGRPGLNTVLLDLVEDVAQVVVDPAVAGRWPDPSRSAAQVFPVLPAPVPAEPGCGWLKQWTDADLTARAVVDAWLDRCAEPTELRMARDVVATIPPGALLLVGASMAVRNVDLVASVRDDVRVVSNRGQSGIDGAISTAVGAALAHQQSGGGHAYALLGDLTAVHDQSGLIIGPRETRPDLTVVVVNNNGGSIFGMLPGIGSFAGFDRLFTTPHDVDLAHVAAAAGWRFTRVTTSAQLPSALRPGEGGTHLVEVRTHPGEEHAERKLIQRAVSAALAHA
ncbi:2-succinyl-5-enolpyruvyl-6-hydroxy-3-cyclohexene-1-carboxylic-acid synthase [Kibdelosporangium phytohabitans]|uniref:2-succinyl-5-enolpyruvyl-6-hydroxy-3-cyclohexene-1-carboxylate synthase n=1 Tax=Kibdelosporangium phytohabitans TaxID=860235 RepID=A0A0N9IIT0_9PSEU|nr:2-succinyl-5-enolpyruvyl-6-hydroxy-3-cyclohexene-1-carboxylic-acid synthase [Kibdelosporangium phytohabitans]ALG14973.1 2-succinyl-5-enolpyruvyl-6-hydroxy-3-cyclohexene-1-carboxylate synthase [Kibdelosporangium phytohabitans]